MHAKERIFGLDLLRATAVLLVVFHHSLSYTEAPHWLSSLGWVGEMGVGALLLLSGYLIGQGLIKKSRLGRFTKFDHLQQFYARRWWRTLPPYYLYLLLMAAMFPPFLDQLVTHRSYFFFLQNFAWNIPPFYSQTWTLAVLEFFYLLFPLLLFLTSKFTRNYLVCILVPMALLFAVPLILKALHTQIETPVRFDQIFRKWVVFRIDTPIVGVATALLQAEWPLLWAWFLRRSWIGLVSLFGVMTYHAAGCPGLYSSHWLQVFFYPLSALAMAPILPFLCEWKLNRSPWGLMMSTVSQASYSLYVCHFMAFILGLWLLTYLGLPGDRWLVALATYFVLISVITCCTYYLTEEPFIRLRENAAGAPFPSLSQLARRSWRTIFANPTSAGENPATPLVQRPPG